MIRGLYTAVSGLVTAEAKQQVITNNMANVNTTGFKSDNLAVKKFDDVLIQNYDKIVGGKNVRNVIGSLSFGSKIDEVSTDYSQALHRQTDKPTDFALQGSGFFTIAREALGGNPQTYYTRDGQFHVNSRGYLVSDNGDNIIGINSSNGNKEPVYVGNAEITTDYLNNIYLNGVPSYKLSLADFEDYSALRKVGDNLYYGENPIENTNTVIKQGALEKSNVNIINEMINMMTVMRTFESNQKIIQSMDETLGKAVNEVGVVR